ncbi:M20/M25/M40 family metallo-hydrolase [Parvularcula sp. ZS-1/3]|uniref:M20/M25/M40 family metallo-hydrolase n=1 Tax=Parvularcula mediterranea TaxID=2732508 RepID=A0A7Y3W5Z1_9PROT|nr:M28 family peptidase [Parvularcula mediterranea]NNU16776.1 M20/M25/M40 family metallo-hydrolase [Parvularcula mediterranea]
MINRTILRSAAVLAMAAGLSACASFSPFSASLDKRVKSHVAYLADDALGGRDTGAQGYELASDYVAGFYARSGIAPAAPEYRHNVPLYNVDLGATDGSLTISSKGNSIETTAGENVVFLPAVGDMGVEEARAAGQVVFVGDGIVAPELGLDAYRGIDVSGKIVMMINGAPEIEDNPASVHLRRNDTKRNFAAERGAIGILRVDPNGRAIQQFTNFARPGRTQVSLGQGYAKPLATALLGKDAAVSMFEDAGQDFDAVVEKVRAGENINFSFPASAVLETGGKAEPIDAWNVVGVIPGTDPALKGEAIVLTAHLDHVGTRDDGNPETDDIYNGALDNATGTAIIMEAARKIAEAGENRRTVIVAALTAEEKGLLGAAHLARNIGSLGYEAVANVNIDMPVLVYPLNSIIAFGMEYSSLEAPFKAAAAEVDLYASPDPVPQMSLFVRSDHYRFVQEGIPSLFLFSGMEGENLQNFQTFMQTHYHKPSDDMDLPINWKDAAKFTTLTADLVTRIANDPERPTWNEGVVFAKRKPKG